MNKKTIFYLNVFGVVAYILLATISSWIFISRILLFILILFFYYTLAKIKEMKESSKLTTGIVAFLSIVLGIEVFYPNSYNLTHIIIFLLIILIIFFFNLFFENRLKK